MEARKRERYDTGGGYKGIAVGGQNTDLSSFNATRLEQLASRVRVSLRWCDIRVIG